VLLKYNEAVTHYGSSGSKFVFNQILANNTRAFEVPYTCDLYCVKVVGW